MSTRPRDPGLIATVHAAGRDWEVRPVGYAVTVVSPILGLMASAGGHHVHVYLERDGGVSSEQPPASFDEPADVVLAVRVAVGAAIEDVGRVRVLVACWEQNARRYMEMAELHEAWAETCRREVSLLTQTEKAHGEG